MSNTNRLALGWRWGRMLECLRVAINAAEHADSELLGSLDRGRLHEAREVLRGIDQRAWEKYEAERKPRRKRR